MYGQVEKPNENKNRAVANTVAQKKDNAKKGFGFLNNRPEAVEERKRQDIANKKTQLEQVKPLTTKSHTENKLPKQIQYGAPPIQYLFLTQAKREIEEDQRTLKAEYFKAQEDGRKTDLNLIMEKQNETGKKAPSLIPIGFSYGEETEKHGQELVSTRAKALDQILWIGPGGNLFFYEALKHWKEYSVYLRQKLDEKHLTAFDSISNELHQRTGTKLPETLSEEDEKKLRQVNKLLNDDASDNSWSIGMGDQFLQWLNDGTIPRHANCWEAVIIACEQAGMVDRNEMNQYANTIGSQSGLDKSQRVFKKFILKRPHESLKEPSEADPKIPTKTATIEHATKGSILCFWSNGTLEHVAIYEGKGYCMSIWEAHSLKFESIAVSNVASLIDECIIEVIT